MVLTNADLSVSLAAQPTRRLGLALVDQNHEGDERKSYKRTIRRYVRCYLRKNLFHIVLGYCRIAAQNRLKYLN